MSNDIEKYTNWRAITESDYVTMFIKTWFAFVATLRSLYPDISVFTVDGMPRGDRPFTNKFKESDIGNVAETIKLKNFTDIILKMYKPSRIKVAQIFPQYFLTTFYRINEDFHYQETNIEYLDSADMPKKIKDRTYIDLTIANRFTLVVKIQTNGIYNKKSYNANIRLDVNMKSIINAIDLSNIINIDEMGYFQAFYKKLYDEIQNNTYIWVEENLQGKYTEALTRFVFSKIRFCLMKIGSQIDFNVNLNYINASIPENEYVILKQRPLSLFSQLLTRSNSEEEEKYIFQKLKEDAYLWFIDFVVSLRNALFHEIIDPLDEEWQLIYKNAYLALKVLLDTTTNYLIKNEVSAFIKREYIDNDNEELFDQIKLSLESEAFDLVDYDLIDDDIEVKLIDVSDIDFYDASSITVNNKRAKFRCRAKVLADGRARVFDYNLSQYDKEDDKYYYEVHDEINFNNAEANVEFEVEFEFDLRDMERTAKICNVKPLYFGSIRLSLSNDDDDNEWGIIYPFEDDN